MRLKHRWVRAITPALAGLLLCGLVFPAAAENAGGTGAPALRVGIVDVARVFQEYQRVKNVQSDMEKRFEARTAKLKSDEESLKMREESLKLLEGTVAHNDVGYFQKVQALQMDKFTFDNACTALEQEVEKEKTRDMRDVLNDIKAAIRFVGAQENMEVVLRAPEFDSDFDPAKPANEQNQPKTAAELVRKFRDNPVLYFAQSIDVTAKVINKLNTDTKPAAAAPAVAPAPLVAPK